jgi:hypothetical protein
MRYLGSRLANADGQTSRHMGMLDSPYKFSLLRAKNLYKIHCILQYDHKCLSNHHFDIETSPLSAL